MLLVVSYGNIKDILPVIEVVEVFSYGPSALFLFVVPFIVWLDLKMQVMKYYWSLDQILNALMILFHLMLLLMIGISHQNKEQGYLAVIAKII